jgi:transposase InsO family protein
VNVWLKSGEFRARIGMSKSTLYRKKESGEVKFRETSRGLEFLLGEPGSAPASPCTAGSLMKKNLHNALAVAGVRGELLDVHAKPCHLTSEQQSAMKEMEKLLAPMIAFREGRLPALHLENGRKIFSLTAVVEWLSSQGLASKSKLWRLWEKSDEGKNIEALAPRPRKDRGRLRAFENRPELQKFVTAKWVETENIAFVRDAVKREWDGSLLPHGKDSKPPRYGAIARFIESIPQAVRDCATLTKQKYEALHAPYIVTGRGSYTRPNQVWVADHRLFDVLVGNDSFPYAHTRGAIRLWITVIVDMRTRVIVGWAWSISASWQSIASALHMGISRFGKPELFYMDNGKDFRKIGAGAERGSLLALSVPKELDEHGRVPLSSETQGLLARLGIKVSYCTPFHPQAKQIESLFNLVAKRFDRTFFKHGYTGSKPELRSDFCAVAEKQYKEFLAGKRQKSPLVGAKQFMALHAQWIKEFNESHLHSGRGMEGKTPLAVMDELLPVAQREIPDMLALAPLFWDVQKHKVSNCKIQMNNTTYSAALDDAEGQANIFQANESVVAVHCDPNDMANALAFEDVPSGRLLACLVSDELAAQAPITVEHVKAVARQRAKLRKASMQSMAALTTGVPTEIELLEARATGTDGAAPVASAVNYIASQRRRRLPSSSPFVSDDVAKDRGVFADLKLED